MSVTAELARPETASPRALEVRLDTPADACDAYVRAHPDGRTYHRRGWTDLIGRAFGHDTRYLTARSGEQVVGVLPLVVFRSPLFGRFAVSLPFVNYGGVLADDAATAQVLLDAAIAQARSAGGSHLELRHTTRRFEALQPKQHKVAMLLPLADTVDAQWQALDRKLRNQVRKGEKSDLEVHVGGLELLPVFYAVFARNMRDLGTPVYGEGFFREVLSTFPDETRILAITHKGQPAAASLVHWYRGTIEVPWASAIREYNALSANVLLYWHMLKFSVERGLATFDFGRSTPGEGTFLFKKQWGAEPSALVWEYWMADGRTMPDMSPKNAKFSLAIDIWQRLPLAVANALGPHIVRNIP